MSRWKAELIRRYDQAMKVLQGRLWTIALEAIFKHEMHRSFNKQRKYKCL